MIIFSSSLRNTMMKKDMKCKKFIFLLPIPNNSCFIIFYYKLQKGLMRPTFMLGKIPK